MQTAIHAGFVPEMLPSWENMKQLAAESLKNSNLPLTEQLLSERWKQALIYPGRTWRICDQCFPPLFQYLPKTLPTLAQSTPGLEWVVPVNTSVWAIFAGYAGLFSVLFIPAPIALILGIIAWRHIRANRHLAGRGRAIFAIVMGTIFTLFLFFFEKLFFLLS
jgi:hypothetical protein